MTTEQSDQLGHLIFSYCDLQGRTFQIKKDIHANIRESCVEIGSTKYLIVDANIDRVEILARCAYKTNEEQKLEKIASVVNVLHKSHPLECEIAAAMMIVKSCHFVDFLPSTLLTYHMIEIAATIQPFLHGYVHIEYVLRENHVFKYGPSDSISNEIYRGDYPDRC